MPPYAQDLAQRLATDCSTEVAVRPCALSPHAHPHAVVLWIRYTHTHTHAHTSSARGDARPWDEAAPVLAALRDLGTASGRRRPATPDTLHGTHPPTPARVPMVPCLPSFVLRQVYIELDRFLKDMHTFTRAVFVEPLVLAGAAELASYVAAKEALAKLPHDVMHLPVNVTRGPQLVVLQDM